MSAPPTGSGPAQPPHLLAPVAVWGVLQLLAVMLAALRVPLSATYPRPAEGQAVEVLVVVQIVALSALFPLLFRTFAAGLLVVAMVWPYLLVAAFLATAPLDATLRTGGLVTAWGACLAVWRWALPTHRQHAIAVAFALLLTLGGGVLAYLAAEYRPDPLATSQHWSRTTPLIAALSQSSAHPARLTPWILIAIPALAGAAVGIVRSTKHKAST